MDRIIIATGIPFSDWIEFGWTKTNRCKLPEDILMDPGFNGFIALVKPNISQFTRGNQGRFPDKPGSIEISIVSHELIDTRDRSGYTAGRKRKFYNSYFDVQVIPDSVSDNEMIINRSAESLLYRTLKDYCDLTSKYYNSSSGIYLEYPSDIGLLQDRKRLRDKNMQCSILATLFWAYEKIGY